MKILDIIAGNKSLDEGVLSRLGGDAIERYMEKRAAEAIVRQIEKQYAGDAVKQKAAKDLADRYAKVLLDAEQAGTPVNKGGIADLTSRLENISKDPKHPYYGTKYHEDPKFVELVDRLAEARKVQIAREAEKAAADAGKPKPEEGNGKPKEEPKSKAPKEEVGKTEEHLNQSAKEGKMVGDSVRAVKYWASATLGLVGLGEIERDYDQDMADIKAQFDTETIGKSDAPYFPPVVTEGVPVSSIVEYAYYIDSSGKKQPYVYETKLGRLRSWRDWREANAGLTKYTRMAQFLVAWGVGAGTLWPLSKLKWLAELAKKIDVSKSAGPIKRGLSMSLQSLIATLNTGGAMWFAREMGKRDMNDALRNIIWNDLSSYYPAADKIWSAAGASTMGHTAAIAAVIYAGKKALEIAGLGVKPRVAEPGDNTTTTNVPAANPNDQDPSQRKPTDVDKTDSTETGPKPPAPANKPEKKEQPRVAPEDNTPAGRGQRFSTAKENGESTVTINGKTYNTADFKEDGKYWTNDKTGESFLRY